MINAFRSPRLLSAVITALISFSILSAWAQEEDRSTFPKFERGNYIHNVEKDKWTGPRTADGQAFKTAVGAVGKDCKSCHEGFKVK